MMLPERRLCVRYPMHFPVLVRVESAGGARIFDSESVNISKHSIEISGDDEMVSAFLAQNTYPQVCEIQFLLPNSEYEFTIRCQLVNHRRLSQHDFRLALIFTEFYDHCGELLAENLREHGLPKFDGSHGSHGRHAVGGI